MTNSIFKWNRKYYIILKGNKKYKINVTLINKEDREYIIENLKKLRFRKKE